MNNHTPIHFIDLFAGIGGFRYAIQNVGKKFEVPVECVFSNEIDKECQRAYQENFGEVPTGDITQIVAESIPNHDILLAGFPCQPFSIIGKRKGFEDTRGTLFFDIARILKAKKPTAFVLENVKLLVVHDKGKTIKRIIDTLEELGYHTSYKILNALEFGLPQKRERVFIVGFRKPLNFNKYKKRLPKEPTIWHENKAGNISVYPFSCALRAGASYNYLLVNGERRLTSREMLRLQGFPESFKIVCSYTQTRKQAGNRLPVPVAEAIIEKVFQASGWTQI
jgi:DNA (cytosine-5)-methyltransferase 1